jgi:hypothetical protein
MPRRTKLEDERDKILTDFGIFCHDYEISETGRKTKFKTPQDIRKQLLVVADQIEKL